MRPCVHFVGFRGAEYLSAVRVWGTPDFYHPVWDTRAAREIADCDTVVHADGDWTRPCAEKNSHDTVECARLPHLSELAGRALREKYGLGAESG